MGHFGHSILTWYDNFLVLVCIVSWNESKACLYGTQGVVIYTALLEEIPIPIW